MHCLKTKSQRNTCQLIVFKTNEIRIPMSIFGYIFILAFILSAILFYLSSDDSNGLELQCFLRIRTLLHQPPNKIVLVSSWFFFSPSKNVEILKQKKTYINGSSVYKITVVRFTRESIGKNIVKDYNTFR